MRKTYFFLIVILLLTFLSMPVNASNIMMNIYVEENINPAIGIEYLVTDRFSVSGSYVIDEDIFNRPYVINTGLKYYFFDAGLYNYTEEGGPFAEVSTNTIISHSGTSNDINIGGGYFHPVFDNISLSATAGYKYCDLNGHAFHVRAGFNVSLLSMLTGASIDRNEFLKRKYGWDDEIIEAVINREMKKGMTRKQLKESLGEPDRIEEGGGRDYWVYERFDPEEVKLRQILVFFDGERLERWEVNEISL